MGKPIVAPDFKGTHMVEFVNGRRALLQLKGATYDVHGHPMWLHMPDDTAINYNTVVMTTKKET
jgi:hypothetical protein